MMKSLVKASFIAIIALTSFSLNAQNTAKLADASVAKQVATLTQQLDLSSAQADQVSSILTKANKKYAGLKGKAKAQAQAEVAADIKEVLNEKQAAKYDSLLKKKKTFKKSSSAEESKMQKVGGQ